MERDRLLSENPFKDWMRRDFNAFLRACEKHGRQNIDAVAKEVESKTEEEVKAYAEVFFARYTELQDFEKYIKQIERGEQKIQRQQSIMKVRLPRSRPRPLCLHWHSFPLSSVEIDTCAVMLRCTVGLLAVDLSRCKKMEST